MSLITCQKLGERKCMRNNLKLSSLLTVKIKVGFASRRHHITGAGGDWKKLSCNTLLRKSINIQINLLCMVIFFSCRFNRFALNDEGIFKLSNTH